MRAAPGLWGCLDSAGLRAGLAQGRVHRDAGRPASALRPQKRGLELRPALQVAVGMCLL